MATLGATTLAVRNVTKAFGGNVAVRDLSFDIRDGEFLSIIGPNGAGKSTVFNLISGFHKPDSGTIDYEGKPIVGLRPHVICERGIGRTFQIPQPFTDLTVMENATVAGLVRGTHADARARARHALELTGLDRIADRYPREMTAADLKRLEVARALATGPKLLLLDEVMAGLNPKEMGSVITMIQGLRAEGIACVAGVEHVIAAVVQLSDRIIVLDHGEEIAEGDPQTVLNSEAVITVYLGATPA